MTTHLTNEKVVKVLSSAGVNVDVLSPEARRDIERALDDIFEDGYQAGYEDGEESFGGDE